MSLSPSDSDETRGSDSDVTIPPEDNRDLDNQSPDLFPDYDTVVRYNSDSPSFNKMNSNKRHSRAHEMSDSESDNEYTAHKKTSPSPIKGANKSLKPKSSNKESTYSPVKVKHKNDPEDGTMKRRQFVASFLDMSDSDSDDEREEQIKQMKISKDLKNVSSSAQKPHKKDYSKPLHETIPTKNGNASEAFRNTSSHKVEKVNNKYRHISLEGSEKRSVKHDSSTDSLKRKNSKSPVPQELRRAVTDILMSNENESAKKKKKLPPCRYGSKCYRKNPSHFEEFSHDADKTQGERPRKSTSPPRKNLKTSTDSPSAAASPGCSRDSPSSSSRSTQLSKSPKHPPRSPREVFEQAQPYGICLTKVAGIADKYNNAHAMDIKDILSPGMGNLTASCQFNYMHDIPWLMKQYPAEFRSKPLLIVHGEQGPSKANLQANAMAYTNVKFCQAKLEMMYGTHHTKMMLLLYDTGLRVVIHTSNLIQQDWHQKTQGMWISAVFPRLPKASKEQGDSPTHFKRDLLAYMSAYKAYQLKEWLEHIEQHDMSSAKVVIIGSIPGRHLGEQAKSCWGHLRLKKVLQQHGPSVARVKSWPVIGQFSSIGSMGPNKDSWLCTEFLQSLSATKSGSGMQSSARLQLVFPSKDNVRLSLEGFPAGGSIPYSVNTAKKQTYLHDFFHVWKSEGQGRSRAMPHIKSYLRPNQNGEEAAWFLVTSANLSKAAWGALEKKGVQLMIRSYEIGVLLLPKFFTDSEIFPVTTDVHHARATQQLALPFDIPVQKYEKKDRPWMWDIPYMDLPDTNGNVWCPFSK